jgi:hypothetical protein
LSSAYADDPLEVVALYLVNAESGEDIRQFDPHSTVNLQELPTRKLNIRAVVRGSRVKDVVFGYDQRPVVRTETSVPYALAGDTAGKFIAWTPTLGAHTLTVTARGERVVGVSAGRHTAASKQGSAQQTYATKSLVVPFRVIDERVEKRSPTPTSVPSSTLADESNARLVPVSSSQSRIVPGFTATPAHKLRPSYRIKAGDRGFVDANGVVWQSDIGLSKNASYGEQAVTRDMLGNALYLSGRNSSVGPLEMHVPLPNGEYLVTLHMMELYAAHPGLSLCDVAVEGKPVAEKLDIVQEVGFRQPLRLMRTTTVADGVLDIVLTPSKGVASLSGIEIAPSRP